MIPNREALCAAFAAVLVVSVVAVGPVGGADPADPPAWQGETHYDLARMAERYNAAVDDGADPRLTGERVELTVADRDGATARFRFAVGPDGRLGRIAAAGSGGEQWSEATLLLSTSPGTIDYLSSAGNPVAAFETVFVRLGDVRGPGVARTADGGLEHTDDWVGSRFTVRVALSDGGGDGDGSSGDAVRVLDLRGGSARYAVLPTRDVDGDGRPDVATIAGPGDWVDPDDDGDGLATTLLYRVPLPAGGDAAGGGTDAAARGIEKHQIKRGMVIAKPGVSGGGDCDDADPPVFPGDAWYQPRCDGGVDVEPLDADADGDGVLYISVEEEGAPRTLREDATESAARRGDNGSKPGRTTYANFVFERVSTPDGDGSATGDGDAPATVFDVSVADGHPSNAPVVYETTVAGNNGDATLFVDGPETRPIEPVTARGVGLVGRLKWGVVSVLRGLGLF